MTIIFNHFSLCILVGIFTRSLYFYMQHFCNIPHPVHIPAIKCMTLKDNRRNQYSLYLSVGIFKCNKAPFQINYTGKMITGHYYVWIQIRFSISKLVQHFSHLVREDTEVTTWTLNWWYSNIPAALLRTVKLHTCSQLWRKPEQ